jgi:thymidylate kinase
MMRIIVLQGIQNTGKSITLNLLYSMLVPSSAQSHNNRVVLGDPAQNDFSETVAYHNELIEFFTMGDYPKQLEMAIKNAANRKVNVFICACSRHTLSLIAAFQLYRTAFVSKTFTVISRQQIFFNTADAQTLLNMI